MFDLTNNKPATPAGGVKPSKPILYNEESIKLDMQLETWPLSCYSPEKDVYPPLNIIAGVDSSPEEVRMEYYKARSSPALMHAFVRSFDLNNNLLSIDITDFTNDQSSQC